MPQKKKKNTSKRGEGKLPTTRRVSTATNSGSSSSSSGTPGQGLVSNAERAGFVEAVVAGKLKPNLTAVAYHFEGWLDRDVMEAVLEATSDPTEAVSILASMSPPTAAASATAATAAPEGVAKTAGAAISSSHDKCAVQPSTPHEGAPAASSPAPAPAPATAPAAPAAASARAQVTTSTAGATEEAVPPKMKIYAIEQATSKISTTTERGNINITRSSSSSGAPGKRLVSTAERAAFVEAVVAGKLKPDFTAVAYHFEGWLDRDVVDAVLEATSDPTEAVSALAGMSPPAEAARATAAVEAATSSDSATEGANQRHARTLEAIQAHDESCPPSNDPARTSAATTLAVEDGRATATPSVQNDVEVPSSNAKDDNLTTSNNDKVELEKVAAFIASYAGEQEAAAKGSRSAMSKPQAPPFFVPRGVMVPSTRQAQLVIASTAEKTVELPGFEAFMKIEHGKDTLFRFLAVDHTLHGYYLLAKNHLQETVLHGRKAKGACAAVPRNKAPPAPRDTTPPEDPDVAEIMRMLGGGGP